MIFRVVQLLAALSFVFPARAQPVSGTGPADDPTRQTDADWIDNRWSKTEIGQFLHATIDTPQRKTPKGIAIKVGPNNEATVCFDTDLLRYSAGWAGGFLQQHAQRYGLIAAPTPVGKIQFSTEAGPGWAKDDSFTDPRAEKFGALPRAHAKYKGFYLHGERVVLSYTVGESTVLDSPWFQHESSLDIFTRTLEISPAKTAQSLRVLNAPISSVSLSAEGARTIGRIHSTKAEFLVSVIGRGTEVFVVDEALNVRILAHNEPIRVKILICNAREKSVSDFSRIAKSTAPESLSALTHGGPTRWGAPLVTKGHVDSSKNPLGIDTITIPYENPWNALFFTSGHDFFSNGDAAVATIHGDVWRVSGLDSTLEKVSWKRFATGLYQPLGLKIIGDKVHVLERDQITKLHDLNSDGEADFYENVNNDCISAGGGHSYATSLETDSKGNFYFTKCAENTPHGGTLLKVAAHGASIEVVATGFRNPNGLGIGPGDLITVADQQGDWVPETRLDVIRPGGFYGFTPMSKRVKAPTSFDPPLCWIPRAIDNSAGGQVWIPEGTWGPFGGQMLHLSYGRCTMMMILRDGTANPPVQGAVVPLPGRFVSGVCRGRFSPNDHHLYLTGLRGWQTAAVRDGCFQRVRLQKAFATPIAYSTAPNTFSITFSEPIDRELAEDLESYSAETWNYKWTSNYGSPDFSVRTPEKLGRDAVKIRGAKLSDDGRTVALTIPELRAAMQFALTFNLETAGGEPLQNSLYATINLLR
jgi:hypothetical protein